MTKIVPLGDRIVVQADSEEVTKSGIVLPDTASKDRPKQGTVKFAGPGKKNKNGEVIPMEVQVGDTVLFREYSPTEVEVDGDDLLILSQEDVLAKINK